jgi:hypothetical protein
MPGRGAALPEPLDVLAAGGLLWVAVEDVAAFAIAAPPPATAAVRASVVRRGFIRWLNVIHLLRWPGRTIALESLKCVGER